MVENDKKEEKVKEEKVNEEILRENKEFIGEESTRTTPKMERPKPWSEPPVEGNNTEE